VTEVLKLLFMSSVNLLLLKYIDIVRVYYSDLVHMRILQSSSNGLIQWTV